MDEASSSQTLLPFAALTFRAYDKTISICLYAYIFFLGRGGGGCGASCSDHAKLGVLRFMGMAFGA